MNMSTSLSEAVVRPVAQPALEPSKPAISVIGLGYVGAVSMACLSHLGFRMVGVDVSHEKVRAIKAGQSPIVEAPRQTDVMHAPVAVSPDEADEETDHRREDRAADVEAADHPLSLGAIPPPS